MADEVLVSITDGIASVTLNRPEKRNAMNRALLQALSARFDELDSSREVRVIVVRGAGPAFCSGMDLREMEEQRGAAGDPEGAMIHGDAIAGGCELALHCDLRVAAEEARLGMPLARIGLVVPFPLGQKLVEIIGPSHTRELLFTGRPIEATRARDIGMVHRVVPAAQVEAETYELARAVAANAPLSLQGMKATVLRAISQRGSISHDDLDLLASRARTSADASEGRRAMLEKRRPIFRGE